jgi:RecJ-like exonuclease
MSLCSWCFGCGEVRIPMPKIKTAFGMVRREATTQIPCPQCGGSGEVTDHA